MVKSISDCTMKFPGFLNIGDFYLPLILTAVQHARPEAKIAITHAVPSNYLMS